MATKKTQNFKGGRKKRDAPSSGCETHVGLYTDEEVQFLNAVQAFQKRWKLRFLSHTHYLRIFKEMGYTHQTKLPVASKEKTKLPVAVKPKLRSRRKARGKP